MWIFLRYRDGMKFLKKSVNQTKIMGHGCSWRWCLIFISSPGFFLELQTQFSTCLLDISLWISHKHFNFKKSHQTNHILTCFFSCFSYLNWKHYHLHKKPKPGNFQLSLLFPALQLRPDESTTKGLSIQSPLLHPFRHLSNSGLNISLPDHCICVSLQFSFSSPLTTMATANCVLVNVQQQALEEKNWSVAFDDFHDIYSHHD